MYINLARDSTCIPLESSSWKISQFFIVHNPKTNNAAAFFITQSCMLNVMQYVLWISSIRMYILQGVENFLEQSCFEISRTKLLMQKNHKILQENEEQVYALANSSLVAIYVFITLACQRVQDVGALLRLHFRFNRH